ncbi:uncharacterized protein BYT42DRAFT_319306 [Radiomyces spectabilis]|uniref:uncharacterized protein n=1 Tax=Radiomyces spectabilis TaxID=64574 RepID=UPI00221F1C7A|nr:uncharacterized protein BYT42DRAFT_319306 [Radiomyces spectabilis]KAI8379220.1 hypothetical protein BYT42DRAFT_319306 [Radiomyces spectabilis]
MANETKYFHGSGQEATAASPVNSNTVVAKEKVENKSLHLDEAGAVGPLNTVDIMQLGVTESYGLDLGAFSLFDKDSCLVLQEKWNHGGDHRRDRMNSLSHPPSYSSCGPDFEEIFSTSSHTSSTTLSSTTTTTTANHRYKNLPFREDEFSCAVMQSTELSAPDPWSVLSCSSDRKSALFLEDDQSIETASTWDLYSDAFDVFRDKITSITRSMQNFQLQELLGDEHPYSQQKQIQSQHECRFDASDSKRICRTQRDAAGDTVAVTPVPSHFDASYVDTNDGQNIVHSPDQWRREATNHAISNVDEKRLRISTLYSTTNCLVETRASEKYDALLSFENDSASTHWQSQFLDLLSSCIGHAETLESLSNELLGTEGRVRNLLIYEKAVDEVFQSRERMYLEKIHECQQVARQQLLMLNVLEELMAGLDRKSDQLNNPCRAVRVNGKRPSENRASYEFRRRAATETRMLTHPCEFVQRLRLHIGTLIGGTVGTGQLLYTFQDEHHDIRMIIAGSGFLVHPSFSTYQNARDELDPLMSTPTMYHHRYMLDLSTKDRQSRFVLLPKEQWTPDRYTDQCQFVQTSSSDSPTHARRCVIQFNFFRRKHHCRR